jgi:hypothetical protein
MKKLSVLMLVAVVALFCLNALAADAPKQPSPEEMQKMMEAWQKSATPGEHHQVFTQMAGDWTYHMKMWMDPKAPASESDGTGKNEVVFDGRYLSMSGDGMMMGMPFKGMGTLGYDNGKGEYQMTWIDNMGTMTTTAQGKPGADAKVITLTGKMDDPMTGEKDKAFKYVFKVTDKDHHVLEGWDLAGTPQEFKVMEITYTRKK